jgi:hypothetical protein
MRYKATFVTGFGIGYVLGSKAGRARYEQLSRMASAFWRQPAVQGATSTVTAQATSLLDTAKSKVSARIGGEDVTDRIAEPASIRL